MRQLPPMQQHHPAVLAAQAHGMQAPHPTTSLLSPPIATLLQRWGSAGSAHTTPPDDATRRALRWNQWLGTVGAIRLSRALHAIDALPAHANDHHVMPEVTELKAAVEATKAEVVAFIHAPAVQPKPGRERADNSHLAPPDRGLEADLAVHGQRLMDIQKQMQTQLSALRAHLRSALTQGPRALQQLAALDAEMETLLGEREQRLWSFIPAQIEARWAHWHPQHALERPAPPDAPLQQGHQPGDWLRRFEQDAQALLLTEMQARLQPIMGLLAAAQDHHDRGHQPQQPSQVQQ